MKKRRVIYRPGIGIFGIFEFMIWGNQLRTVIHGPYKKLEDMPLI